MGRVVVAVGMVGVVEGEVRKREGEGNVDREVDARVELARAGTGRVWEGSFELDRSGSRGMTGLHSSAANR